MGGSTVERFEALSEEHVDECARVLISAFNEQPWNERWTPQTARAELLCTMSTPGFLGFASFDGEVGRFAAGYPGGHRHGPRMVAGKGDAPANPKTFFVLTSSIPGRIEEKNRS